MKSDMTALDMLFTRRSVRNFTEEPVRTEDLETILRAGMFAPSAHNGRTWSFITVTKRETLDELSAYCRYWKPLLKAQAAIVCCCSGTRVFDHEIALMQNGSAAVENMLLCIHALGLGGVWLNCYKGTSHCDQTKALLQIPEDVMPVACIAAGHPAPDLPPRPEPLDRFEPQKWHKEIW